MQRKLMVVFGIVALVLFGFGAGAFGGRLPQSSGLKA